MYLNTVCVLNLITYVFIEFYAYILGLSDCRYSIHYHGSLTVFMNKIVGC